MRFVALLLFACFYSNVAYSQYTRYVPVYPHRFPYEINEDRIHSRWRIQDEYRERNKTENALDRKERMYDQAMRAYELEKRENDLIREGVLPPRKRPEIVFQGKSYSSYYELKESSAYQHEIESKQRDRELKELVKKQQKARDNAFMQMWHKMGPIGRERYGQLSDVEKEQRIDEFLDPKLQRHNLEQKENLKFYESYPHLVPNQGKNGYPPFPFSLLEKKKVIWK